MFGWFMFGWFIFWLMFGWFICWFNSWFIGCPADIFSCWLERTWLIWFITLGVLLSWDFDIICFGGFMFGLIFLRLGGAAIPKFMFGFALLKLLGFWDGVWLNDRLRFEGIWGSLSSRFIIWLVLLSKSGWLKAIIYFDGCCCTEGFFWFHVSLG